jgi:CTP synthase (UTP-ammonia lyase)
VELADHSYFIATLFVPQLSSNPSGPHPLVLDWLRAAAEFYDVRANK